MPVWGYFPSSLDGGLFRLMAQKYNLVGDIVCLATLALMVALGTFRLVAFSFYSRWLSNHAFSVLAGR
jgi:hypothetical protein